MFQSNLTSMLQKRLDCLGNGLSGVNVPPDDTRLIDDPHGREGLCFKAAECIESLVTVDPCDLVLLEERLRCFNLTSGIRCQSDEPDAAISKTLVEPDDLRRIFVAVWSGVEPRMNDDHTSFQIRRLWSIAVHPSCGLDLRGRVAWFEPTKPGCVHLQPEDEPGNEHNRRTDQLEKLSRRTAGRLWFGHGLGSRCGRSTFKNQRMQS